jgi:hypothetical protein
VVGPEYLLEVASSNGLQWFFAFVPGGKRKMACRMPILGCYNDAEAGGDTVYYGYNSVAVSDLQRPSRTEIVLNIDNDQSGLFFRRHFAAPCFL